MTPKSPIVQRLDEVQSRLATLLKPVGFARKGRAFRRETECGILQIIALQVGRFEVGPPLLDRVKHWRQDNYGEFTVNIGVYVKEMFERTDPPRDSKGIFTVSHCDIRTRLSGITDNDDQWWSLTENVDDLTDDIGALLLHVGIPRDRPTFDASGAFGRRDGAAKRGRSRWCKAAVPAASWQD